MIEFLKKQKVKMPKTQIIRDESQIQLSKAWTSTPEQIVEKEGKTYRVITKERHFTCCERRLRKLLGVILAIITLTAALKTKFVDQLLHAKKKTKLFAIEIEKPKEKNDENERIVLGSDSKLGGMQIPPFMQDKLNLRVQMPTYRPPQFVNPIVSNLEESSRLQNDALRLVKEQAVQNQQRREREMQELEQKLQRERELQEQKHQLERAQMDQVDLEIAALDIKIEKETKEVQEKFNQLDPNTQEIVNEQMKWYYDKWKKKPLIS